MNIIQLTPPLSILPRKSQPLKAQHQKIFFGDISDELLKKTHAAYHKEMLSVVQSDFGAGVTGLEVLSLIDELVEKKRPFVEKQNRMEKMRYEQDLARHKKNPFKRFFRPEPFPPRKEAADLSLYEIYSHYSVYGLLDPEEQEKELTRDVLYGGIDFDEVLDRVSYFDQQGFQDTPRIKGAYKALQKLAQYELITGIIEGYWSVHPSEYADFRDISLTQKGRQVLEELKFLAK